MPSPAASEFLASLNGGSVGAPDLGSWIASRRQQVAPSVSASPGRSIFGQISDVVAGLPRGLAHFASDLGPGTLVGFGKLAADVATGHTPRGAGFEENLSHYFKGLGGLEQSMGRTVGDIEHPTHFARASRDSSIVAKLLEDVGNVAIVGGAASKGATMAAGRAAATAAGLEAGGGEAAALAAARAARLAEVASKVRTFTHGAGEMAASPAKVWTVPLRGVEIGGTRYGILPAVQAALRPIMATETGKAFSTAVQAGLEARGLDTVSRGQRRDLRENFLLTQLAEGQRSSHRVSKLIEASARDYQRAAKSLGVKMDTAVYARHLYEVGGIPGLRALAEVRANPLGLADETIGRIYEGLKRRGFGVEHGLPEPVLDLALQIADGTVAPAGKAILDRAWEREHKAIGLIEDLKVSSPDEPTGVIAAEGDLHGGYRKGGPMDPEQLGDQPLTARVEHFLAPLRARYENLSGRIEGVDTPGGLHVAGLADEALSARRAVPQPELGRLVPEPALAAVRRVGQTEGDLAANERLYGQLAAKAQGQVDVPAVAGQAVESGATLPLERAVLGGEGPRQQAVAAGEQAAGAREAMLGELTRKAEGDLAARPLDFNATEPVPIPQPMSVVEARRFTLQARRAAKASLAAQRVEAESALAATIGHEAHIRAPDPSSPTWDYWQELREAIGPEGIRIVAPRKAGGTPLEEVLNLTETGKAHGQELSGGVAMSAQIAEIAAAVNRIVDIRRAERSMVGSGAADAGQFAGDPVEAAALTRGSVAEVVDAVVAAHRAEVAAHIERLLPEPELGPAPWSMNPESFKREVYATADVLDEWDIRPNADPLDRMPPQVEAAGARAAELLPRGITDERSTIEQIHARIVDLATRLGKPNVHGTEEAAATAARGAAEAEQRAIDAFEADTARRALPAGERARSAYAELGQHERAIYKEMVAQSRHGDAQALIEQRRQALAEKLVGKGARAGQLEGEAAAYGKVAQQAGDRMDVLGRRLEPVVGLTAEEQAARKVAEGMARPVREGVRIGKRERDAQLAERALRQAERSRERLGARIAAKEQELGLGPVSVAPGRYKPSLFLAQNLQAGAADLAERMAVDLGDQGAQWVQQIMADLPVTMTALHDQGVHPEYVPGGIDTPQAGGGLPGRREQLPWLGKVASEHRKREGLIPQKIETVGRKLVKDVTDTARNKAALRVDEQLAMSGHEIADEVGLAADVRDEWSRNIRKGEDIAAWAKEHRYVAWDLENPTSTVPPGQVTLESRFLPEPLFNEFRRWFKPAADKRWLELIDKPTRAWKHMVLALSPSWQINNLLGNAMLATVGAGLSPGELARYAGEVRRLLLAERDTGEMHFNPRLYGAGQPAEMTRQMAEHSLAPPRTPIGKLMRWSYSMNEFVDNWTRSTIYTALKEGRGMADDEAVRLALRAAGDFGKMTAFERDFVRRTFPFYAWSRHITQLMWHLAIDHPFRLAWTMHMGQLFGGDEGQRPAFLKGAGKIGGGYFSFAGLNPFENSIGTPFSAPSEWVPQVMRGLNPVARVGIGALTNINLSRGRPYTRPNGTGPIDENGRFRFGFLSPGELFYVLTQQTPLGRFGFDAWHRNEQVVRYDEGLPIKRGGQPIPLEGGTLERLMRDLGVPWTFTVDVAQANATRDRRMRELAAARRRYFG